MIRAHATTNILLGLAFCTVSLAARSQTVRLTDVRSAYRAACKAPQDRATVESFVEAAEQWTGDDTSSAYQRGLLATARMMRAETLWNPLEKLQTFQSQRDPLEAAIADAPDHPELRLFRLSVQWSVPFFLDYSSDMDDDAASVAAALESGYWADDVEQGAFALTFLEHLRDDASK